jgi:4a-hydroxytetrahydrobiopterin dehydratase
MHTAPRFSQGVDEVSATSALGGLLSQSGGRWTLAKEGEALERTFKFKTFAKTWV